MQKKGGFTLLELIITMAILGVFFVLLLKTYNRISTMVFRVQQEKEVSQEVLQVSQIVQNFSDRNEIDYAKYLGTGDEGQATSLVDTDGITDVLYLSGLDGQIALYSSGDCIDPAATYSLTGAGLGCSLFVDMSGAVKALFNTKKVFITKAIFKIIPFASQQQYLNTDNLCEEGEYLHCINAPGFRMIFQAYSPNYGKQRATHVALPFQQFF